MRVIPYTAVVEAVAALCRQAATQLPSDVVGALRHALALEASPGGKAILEQCLANADLACAQNDPICQDTGAAVYFVAMGSQVAIEGGTLAEAINEGTRLGYRSGYLRKSIVADPLFDRKNTGDNTPAMIHLDLVPGDVLSIDLLPKGGGSENVSGLSMLKPAEGAAGVLEFVVNTVVKGGGNPCPPVIVGVGVGGTADKAMFLAKKALLRPLGQRNPDERYSKLEDDVLRKINASGIGPQGLGGTVTALGVHIEQFPCHIASLPVAVTVNCHAARRAQVRL